MARGSGERPADDWDRAMRSAEARRMKRQAEGDDENGQRDVPDEEQLPAEDLKLRGWAKGRKASTGEEPVAGGAGPAEDRLVREESGTLRREGGSVHRAGRLPGGQATSDTASDRAAEGKGKMTGEEAEARRAAKPGRPAKTRRPA